MKSSTLGDWTPASFHRLVWNPRIDAWPDLVGLLLFILHICEHGFWRGEHQVIASPPGTFSNISLLTRFLAWRPSSCLYFLAGSNPSLGINRCIRSELPLFQFLVARFLRLLPRLASLPWFFVEHVVSSRLLFGFLFLFFRLVLYFTDFLIAGLAFRPVISCPRRWMEDDQWSHTILDGTSLLRYNVIQCRFALGTEERVLNVWDLPTLNLGIIVISTLRESYLSLAT